MEHDARPEPILAWAGCDEKIVWGARMISTDLKALRDLLDDLEKVGRAELKKQKVL